MSREVKSIRLDLTKEERKLLKLIVQEEGFITATQVIRYLIRKHANKIREQKHIKELEVSG